MMRSIWKGAVALTVLQATASATPLGLSTDPAGFAWDRGDAGTAYAVWDSYSSFTFANDAPDSSGSFTNPQLTQTTALVGTVMTDQGAGIYDNLSDTTTPGTDIFYGGGRGGSFTFEATSAFPVKGLYLQIKRVASETSFVGAIQPTLNGIAFDSVSSISGGGDTTHDTGLYSVTTWFWGESLAGQDITNLSLAFTTPTHRGVDGIAIDASAVPEPAALGLIGIAAAAFVRRRPAR